MSGAQIKVLLSLRGDDAVPMSVVASRLDYDASKLTTLVERLRAAVSSSGPKTQMTGGVRRCG